MTNKDKVSLILVDNNAGFFFGGEWQIEKYLSFNYFDQFRQEIGILTQAGEVYYAFHRGKTPHIKFKI